MRAARFAPGRTARQSFVSRRAIGVIFTAIACVVTPCARAQVPDLPVQEWTLDNGLRVLVQRDERARRVGVSLSYHVGLRTTPHGFRGLPHIVEHLMFSGSRNAPRGVATYYERAGGSGMNAVTGYDDTTYYVELPPRALELAMWLESDRMAHLVSEIDTADVEREKRVVLQEFGEKVTGRVDGWLPEVLHRALYPENHPYHLLGDDPEDVSRIRVEHVQWFLQTYYVPDNATLAIVGDVDPQETIRLVRRYFESVPRGLSPLERAQTAPVRLERQRWITFDAPSHTDRLVLIWPSPAFLDHDDAVLDVLAKILDRRLETLIGGPVLGAGATQASHHATSQFTVGVELEAGTDPTPILAAIDSYLSQLQSQELREEVVSNHVDSASDWVVLGYEGFDTRAQSLSASPPGVVVSPYFLERRYPGIDATDVRRVASEWLPSDGRIVIHVRSDGDAPMGGHVAGRTLPATASLGSVRAAGGGR